MDLSAWHRQARSKGLMCGKESKMVRSTDTHPGDPARASGNALEEGTWSNCVQLSRPWKEDSVGVSSITPGSRTHWARVASHLQPLSQAAAPGILSSDAASITSIGKCFFWFLKPPGALLSLFQSSSWPLLGPPSQSCFLSS